MAIESLQLSILLVAIFFSPSATTTSMDEALSASPPESQAQQQELIPESLSPTSLFEPILSHLGFHDLAMAVPSLTDSPSFTTWNGPSTLFAPSDSSIVSCASCSIPRILSEHIVPGLFSFNYLQKLAFGTKVETMSSGHCLTITSGTHQATNTTRIFINGVEISHPDMFSNGVVVVHGLEGFIAPLSPFSCSVEKMTSLAFPFLPLVSSSPSPLMRLMLRDAVLRLRTSGFGILALAIKIKYSELANLQSATIFTVDDISIFTGAQSYVSNVRFHIVPNRYLAIADLERLPAGTLLPSLERGQYLAVTTAGGAAMLRINYVRMKSPDVMKNQKIVVHSLSLPFPHLHPASLHGLVNRHSHIEENVGTNNQSMKGSCAALEEHEGCEVIPP
ncbi:fasciclin-like arabinogalactan protein 21 [Rhodamnia argentea]|uniref:Fasciclin-like arabinogalactan protein 21 n=1 Tax=Rhodamnia argentea TaxID=178133 RepID=A0A8B8Q2C8_9MYRT|nr:fasciclin-like arabinogalactan protein 21 [Rhodamnia argentea]